MNPKAKYYKLFGLSETAGKNEIRKAYRKLAMQFHPDRNPDPKAHQVFIDLTEAYEYLTDTRNAPQKQNSKRNERSFEERKKEAEIRFQKQKFREKREQDFYFKKMTSGKLWKAFTYYTYLCSCISLLLLIEPILPSHFENHQIKAFSDRYNGLAYNNQVICLKTNRDLKLFVRNPYSGIFTSQPEIQIERSMIFRNPIHVWHLTIGGIRKFDVDFSVVNLYPLIPLLFLIPFITFYFKRKSYWFTLGYISSLYMVLPCVIYFIFTQDRWIHFLTLGFL